MARLRPLVSLLALCVALTGLTASASWAGGAKTPPPPPPKPPSGKTAPTLPADPGQTSTTSDTASADTSSSSVGDTSVLTDSSQLVDISRQVADIQKKIATLQGQGQYARLGQLSLNATCGYEDASQVFMPWGDPAYYALTGASAGGWALHNVLSGADENPFAPGLGSFSFGEGSAQATSPTMCVNLQNPTIRLFVRDQGGNGKADLRVNVIYEGTDGKMNQLTIAKLHATDTWQPSIIIPIGVNILSTASQSGITAVAFQFKPEGLQKGETITIDNVYVDPFLSR